MRRRAVSCRLSAYRCCCLLDSIPERKRVQAPAVPRFKPPSGCALGGSGSAHRAGWFKGSYKVHSVEAGSVPPFYNAPEGRHHNPLNPLNPLNLLNLCPHNPSTQPFFTTCREAALKLAPVRAPYLASAAILYNSRGRSPQNPPGRRSRSRAEPIVRRKAHER